MQEWSLSILTLLLRSTFALTIAFGIVTLAMQRCHVHSTKLRRWTYLAVILQGWMWIQIPISIPMISSVARSFQKDPTKDDDVPSESMMTDRNLRSIHRYQKESSIPTDDILPKPHLPRVIPWASVLLGVWVAGMLAIVLRAIRSYFRFLARLPASFPIANDWAVEWDELQQRAGMRYRIPLLVVSGIGPLVCWQPSGIRLIVPIELWESLTVVQRMAILRHELAHVLRRDIAKSLAVHVLALPHWFNPLAWRSARAFDEGAEWACDDAVRQADVDHVTDYARTLLQLGDPTSIRLFSSPASGSHGLAVRIRRLTVLSPRKDSLMMKSLVLLLLIGCSALNVLRVRLHAQDEKAVKSVNRLTGAKTTGAPIDPVVVQMLAVHETNARKLSHLHLQWVRTEETTDAESKMNHKRADETASIVEMVARLTPEQIADFKITVGNEEIVGEAAVQRLKLVGFDQNSREQKAEIKRLRNSKVWHSVKLQEIFLHSGDYQFREPHQEFQSKVEAMDWSFPKAPLSPKSLVNDYANFSIFSRCSTTKPPARWWHHSAHEGGLAYTMHKQINDVWGTDFPPYTAVVHANWGDRHLIDTFFSQPSENYRSRGEEVINGCKLAKFDLITPQGPHSPRLLLRAAVDLQRGAVPVIIQEIQITEDAHFETFAPWQPSAPVTSHCEILTTHTIQQLPNGGFYPAKSVKESWSSDPDGPQLTLEQWAEVRAGERAEPLNVVHRRKTWDCSLIEIPSTWDRDFFVIPFPEGQQIFDHDVGRKVGALEPIPMPVIGQPAPPWTIAKWLDGLPRSLNDFRGRVVVIHFWDVLPGRSPDTVRMFKNIQDQFLDQPVTFISVHPANCDVDLLSRQIETYIRKHEWHTIAAIDAGRMFEDSVTLHAYGVNNLPCTIIIGVEGKIAYVEEQCPTTAAAYTNGGLLDSEDLPENELEKICDEWLKTLFTAADEPWPIPDGLTDKERIVIHERVMVRLKVKQIKAALSHK